MAQAKNTHTTKRKKKSEHKQSKNENENYKEHFAMGRDKASEMLIEFILI